MIASFDSVPDVAYLDNAVAGQVVERAEAWRKSSYSSGNGGNCVEVAMIPGASPAVALRDSKDAGGPALMFGTNEWRAFTDGIRAGDDDGA